MTVSSQILIETQRFFFASDLDLSREEIDQVLILWLCALLFPRSSASPDRRPIGGRPFTRHRKQLGLAFIASHLNNSGAPKGSGAIPLLLLFYHRPQRSHVRSLGRARATLDSVRISIRIDRKRRKEGRKGEGGRRRRDARTRCLFLPISLSAAKFRSRGFGEDAVRQTDRQTHPHPHTGLCLVVFAPS